MTLNVDAQQKAQAELDTIVGTERLVTLADRTNLPYVLALIQEVMRWHVPVPLGV